MSVCPSVSILKNRREAHLMASIGSCFFYFCIHGDFTQRLTSPFSKVKQKEKKIVFFFCFCINGGSARRQAMSSSFLRSSIWKKNFQIFFFFFFAFASMEISLEDRQSRVHSLRSCKQKKIVFIFLCFCIYGRFTGRQCRVPSPRLSE